MPFTDPAILQKLAGAWEVATTRSTMFQAIGTLTFPTSMNNQTGTASVTFNSGVMNPPLTSLISIDHMRSVWLGTMFNQANGSATAGVQPLPIATYIYAYPDFEYASAGGSFLGNYGEMLTVVTPCFAPILTLSTSTHAHRCHIIICRRSPAPPA